MSTISVKFKLSDNSEAAESPVLATFPGGPPDEKLLVGGPDGLSFQLLKNKNSRKAKQRVLQCESGDFEFTGKNFGQGTKSEARCMLALFDPSKIKRDKNSSSTKVKLMPVPHFFEMGQNLDGLETSAGAGSKHKLDLDRNTQNRLLTEAFGSRKRQRIVRSAELNRVKLDGGSTSMLKIALSSAAKSSKKAPSAKASGFARAALPKYDLEAEQVEKIYDLNNILSKSQWKLLRDNIAQFEEVLGSVKIEKPEDPKERLPAFILHCLQGRALKAATGKKKKRRLKSLALLQCLFLLQRCGRHKREGLRKIEKIPEAIAERLLEDFTEAVGDHEVFTSPKQEKLMCHIVVLALTACGFTLRGPEIEAFCSDLRLPFAKMSAYFKEVGCSKKCTRTHVELTAPLKLTVLRSGGRGGR